MIPQNTEGLDLAAFELETQPARTYAVDIDRKHVRGHVDEREAMKQAIYLILSVERYKYHIYSWDYGVELQKLIGQPIPLVLPEAKRLITEALIEDDRIMTVDNFNFEVHKGRVQVTFTAHTIFGALDTETEVAI